MIKIFTFIIINLLLISNIALGEDISASGQKTLDTIKLLKIEERWQKGNVVNCKTGEALKKETEQYPSSKLKRLTHGGCFVYSVAEALKLPASSLPPHPKVDKEFVPTLSNKQAEWYERESNKYGWDYIKNKDRDDNFIQAQKLANQGYLVVAVYKNINPKGNSQIAIVVPGNKDIKNIKAEGPDIALVGTSNFSHISLKKGFKNKKAAFKNNEIKFYYFKL